MWKDGLARSETWEDFLCIEGFGGMRKRGKSLDFVLPWFFGSFFSFHG